MSENDKIRILERCLDDGARQVEGLNDFGTSRDQRAMALGGTYVSAATAVAAGLIAWAGQDKASLPPGLLVPGAAAAAMFYIGGALCMWTAFPVLTYVAGNPPKFWQHTLDHSFTYEQALEAQVDEYADKITANAKCGDQAALKFKVGAICGFLAPLVGAMIYLY